MSRHVDWVRWLTLAALLALGGVVFAIAGCARGASAVPDVPDAITAEWVADGRVWLLSDHDTGCQYLMSADGGITPRLSSDGTQYIGGEVLG